jgi:hypothetical protein
MMRFRIVLAAVAASLLVGVPAAGAASSDTLGTVPINGVAKNGKTFTGTYRVDRLVVTQSRSWTVGTLKGRMNGRRVTRSGVKMPAALAPNTAGVAQAGTCSILHLQLAPIDLNLLGLRVQLGGGRRANQVITLNITAQRGGGLLGDLLCGLSGIIPPL